MFGSRYFSDFANFGRVPPRAGGSSASGDGADVAPRFPKLDLIDHLFVIRGLILRNVRLEHMKMGGVGFWIEFLMPIVVIVLHYYIFLALGRYMPANIPIELFVLGGFPVWFTFRNCTAGVTRREEDGPGIFLIPGVTPNDILAAFALWEIVMMMFVLYVGLALSQMLLGNEVLPNVPMLTFLFILAALLGTGYKFFFDSLGWIWPLAKSIKKPLTWLLFLTSGVYYGAQGGKQDFLTDASWYNPLIHIIEPVRLCIWPGYPVAKVSIVYAIGWSVGLFLLGLIMKRLLRPWAH